MDKKKIVLIAIGVVALGSLAYYFKTKKGLTQIEQEEIELSEAERLMLEEEKIENKRKEAVEGLGGTYQRDISGQEREKTIDKTESSLQDIIRKKAIQ
jgi:hypothetical protein